MVVPASRQGVMTAVLMARPAIKRWFPYNKENSICRAQPLDPIANTKKEAKWERIF